ESSAASGVIRHLVSQKCKYDKLTLYRQQYQREDIIGSWDPGIGHPKQKAGLQNSVSRHSRITLFHYSKNLINTVAYLPIIAGPETGNGSLSFRSVILTGKRGNDFEAIIGS